MGAEGLEPPTLRLVRAESWQAADLRVRRRVADLPLTCTLWQGYSPLQGLRVDRDAAVPLAVQLLSESLARPGQRLDERDLSAVGRCARRHHRHPGVLVPGAERAEADDRPAGVRRRRQSRPDARPTARTPTRPRSLELAGWPYPKHLAGRAFAVVVHGDVAGAETCAARCRTGWRLDWGSPARTAEVDRYIGYYEPYATSHDALDRDLGFPGRGQERRAHPPGSGGGQALRAVGRAWKPARGATTEIAAHSGRREARKRERSALDASRSRDLIRQIEMVGADLSGERSQD